ncbi:MAG: hypothetical protein RL071_1906, partial [Pseudomonadota bacterium]
RAGELAQAREAALDDGHLSPPLTVGDGVPAAAPPYPGAGPLRPAARPPAPE